MQITTETKVRIRAVLLFVCIVILALFAITLIMGGVWGNEDGGAAADEADEPEELYQLSRSDVISLDFEFQFAGTRDLLDIENDPNISLVYSTDGTYLYATLWINGLFADIRVTDCPTCQPESGNTTP